MCYITNCMFKIICNKKKSPSLNARTKIFLKLQKTADTQGCHCYLGTKLPDFFTKILLTFP